MSKSFEDIQNSNDIKSYISQIINKSHDQNKMFDQLFDIYEKIKSNLDILDENLGYLMKFEETEEEDDNYTEIDSEKGSIATFNLESQTITYKDKIYQYNKELMFTGEIAINKVIQELADNRNTDNFPQGIDYCEALLKQTKESNGTVIILLNHTPTQKTWFYFIFNEIKQLSCCQGWLISGDKSFRKQINTIKSYKDDIYPQGIDYCMNLLNDQFKDNDCVHCIARNNDNIWTRYYFKSEAIAKKAVDEQLYMVEGKNNLKKELKLIEKNQDDDYPQKIKNCINLLKKQIEIDGGIFVLGYVNKNKNSWLYYPIDKIVFACNAEWWFKGEERSANELNLIDERSASPKHVFLQGVETCKNIILEQEEIGGIVHVLVRNSSTNYWFYIKET